MNQDLWILNCFAVMKYGLLIKEIQANRISTHWKNTMKDLIKKSTKHIWKEDMAVSLFLQQSFRLRGTDL